MTVYYPTFKPAVAPLTLVSEVRELPYAGEVLVRVGNRVEPDEVVARTLVPEPGRRFPVARILGIPSEDLLEGLLVEDGADVRVGDAVAMVGRWRQRTWRAPLSGVLSTAEARQGYLVITPPAQPIDMRAHLKGFVTEVEPYRSVTIQTPAALVRGAFGLGKEQHGVLRAAVTNEADELLPELLDDRATLSILIGGGSVSAEALVRAIELQVRGLIVGSIEEKDLRAFLGYLGDADWQVGGGDWAFPPRSLWRETPLTLMVTEGMGRWPMCSRAFELLTSYDGWEVTIDGRTWLHGSGMRRPKVIVPLPRADAAEIPPDEQAEVLGPGTQVRILSADALGRVGQVVAFPRLPCAFGCGNRYYAVEVRLDDGQVVAVPAQNVEVLGAK